MTSRPVHVLWLIAIQIFTIDHLAFAALKWNKNLKVFESIPGGAYHEEKKQDLALSSRREETHNFNGEPLHLTYYEELGFCHFYENDTKITGILGDLWNYLAKELNFTLVVKKSRKNTLGVTYPNGSNTGIIEDARLNRTDIIPKLPSRSKFLHSVWFTPGYWIQRYRIFTRPHWEQNTWWLFKLFSTRTWCLVCITMVTFSVVRIIMQKIMLHYGIQHHRGLSYMHILFDIFAVACDKGTAPEDILESSKIITNVISLFAWFILISLGSGIIYGLSLNPVVPFKDIQTLIDDTNLNIVVLNGSLMDKILLNPLDGTLMHVIKNSGRFTVASNITDLIEKVCFNAEKYVLLDSADHVALRSTISCDLFAIGNQIIASRLISAGISKRVRFRRSLDIGLIKLRELGIIEQLRRHYIPNIKKISGSKNTNDFNIGLDAVYPIFFLLGLGIIASTVIITTEIICLTRKKGKNPLTLSTLDQASYRRRMTFVQVPKSSAPPT